LKDLNFYVNELDIHGGMLLKEDIITAAPSYIRSLYKRVGFCCRGGVLGGNLAVFLFYFFLSQSISEKYSRKLKINHKLIC
jgi:hypothetical protein